MNYKTYAEAKIANPNSEIVTTGKNWTYDIELIGTFQPRVTEGCSHAINDYSWVICNPANHCSTLKEFLEAGFKFSVGDIYTSIDGSATSIDGIYDATNKVHSNDNDRYILSAAALNGGCEIPAKKMTFINCQELKIGECIGVVMKSNPEWTIYNNTSPLCELTDEQVGKLVKHSGCVEHMNPNSGEWAATIKPMWNRAGVYRIKPKSERELFIENTTKVMRDAGTKCPDNHEYFGIMFDAGARYTDKTQYFGENI